MAEISTINSRDLSSMLGTWSCWEGNHWPISLPFKVSHIDLHIITNTYAFIARELKNNPSQPLMAAAQCRRRNVSARALNPMPKQQSTDKTICGSKPKTVDLSSATPITTPTGTGGKIPLTQCPISMQSAGWKPDAPAISESQHLLCPLWADAGQCDRLFDGA